MRAFRLRTGRDRVPGHGSCGGRYPARFEREPRLSVLAFAASTLSRRAVMSSSTAEGPPPVVALSGSAGAAVGDFSDRIRSSS